MRLATNSRLNNEVFRVFSVGNAERGETGKKNGRPKTANPVREEDGGIISDANKETIAPDWGEFVAHPRSY